MAVMFYLDNIGLPYFIFNGSFIICFIFIYQL